METFLARLSKSTGRHGALIGGGTSVPHNWPRRYPEIAKLDVRFVRGAWVVGGR